MEGMSQQDPPIEHAFVADGVDYMLDPNWVLASRLSGGIVAVVFSAAGLIGLLVVVFASDWRGPTVLLAFGGWFLLSAALAAWSQIGPTSKKAIRRLQKKKRSFLRDLLDNDDLRANPDLVDFALSDPLFSIVTNYLGTIPNLHSVDLVYSVARLMPDEHISSQLFHRDPEGLTQAKVVLNVFDVDEAHGPFTFIPANQSERIVAAIWQQRRKAGARIQVRYRDEDVRAHGGLDATVQLTGPAGTAAIVDMSRCIHAGSRLPGGMFSALSLPALLHVPQECAELPCAAL